MKDKKKEICFLSLGFSQESEQVLLLCGVIFITLTIKYNILL